MSNTTISRPAGLGSPLARETGGLSGVPLFSLSTAVLARAFLLARGRLVLIGVGGVFSGRDALAKIQAGASLVQLYTGFAWHGPALIPRLKRELAAGAGRSGLRSGRGAPSAPRRHTSQDRTEWNICPVSHRWRTATTGLCWICGA